MSEIGAWDNTCCEPPTRESFLRAIDELHDPVCIAEQDRRYREQAKRCSATNQLTVRLREKGRNDLADFVAYSFNMNGMAIVSPDVEREIWAVLDE